MSSKETPKEATAGYVELTTQSYNLFVDAIASANQRALDYTKHVWEISTRPYDASTIESAMRENLERTTEIVNLSIAELQTSGKKTAELAEKLIAHTAKLQETYATSVKGVLETGLSNLNYVKDTAEAQFEDFTKRVEHTEKSVASSVSSN
jgi:hypothetical protein